MTKIVGLTGGIGSGKTWVANYLKFLGVPVFFSDDEAKKIMLSADIVDLIRTAFGEDVIIKKNILLLFLINFFYLELKKAGRSVTRCPGPCLSN